MRAPQAMALLFALSFVTGASASGFLWHSQSTFLLSGETLHACSPLSVDHEVDLQLPGVGLGGVCTWAAFGILASVTKMTDDGQKPVSAKWQRFSDLMTGAPEAEGAFCGSSGEVTHTPFGAPAKLYRIVVLDVPDPSCEPEASGQTGAPRAIVGEIVLEFQ